MFRSSGKTPGSIRGNTRFILVSEFGKLRLFSIRFDGVNGRTEQHPSQDKDGDLGERIG